MNTFHRLALAPAVFLAALAVAQPMHAQNARLGRSGAEALAPDSVVPVVLEGFVLTPDGAPAEGAVISSSAGGQAVAGIDGRYRLEVDVPIDVERVQLTAHAGSGDRTLSSSASVDLTERGGNRADPLVLAWTVAQPDWIPRFGQRPGLFYNDGELGEVDALAVFDDGTGPALYVAGYFVTAGTVDASRVARWDGSQWSEVGGGIDGGALAMQVFDDGSGDALYLGGQIFAAGGVDTNNIVKWDGSGWTPLGSGFGAGVRALAVFDDGSGPVLHAVAGSAVFKWDGASWTPLGSGFSAVYCIAVFDDGSGPTLYVGGNFTEADGEAAMNMAKWNGTSWVPVGSGLGVPGNVILDLAVFDDGSGPALYAGGSFTTAGGVAANRIAKWDGTSWSALGNGTGGSTSALVVFDDGNGPALYAGGSFTTAGGGAANRIAKWDGTSWSALGSGTSGSNSALVVFDDGGGPALFAGGVYATAGGVPANSIAKWNGSGWEALGKGRNNQVNTLATFDDGNGSALYAAGVFPHSEEFKAKAIARWSGSSWEPLGDGVTGIQFNQFVAALTVHDDGSGPALYVGGYFDEAGELATANIARWDGASWSALGSGLNAQVDALASFDDGSGPALYAGGGFTTAGGTAANRIAEWNGSTWSSLGPGMNSYVVALAAFDDGGGPALYAGGGFTSAGGVAANYVARWSGLSWSALGSGVNFNLVARVLAMTVFDDGSGPALYVGGGFTTAGGQPASKIAKWDGSSWSALGSGIGGQAVHALTVFDDGRGPALYAGGAFTSAGGVAVNGIARWDGSSWAALGVGTGKTVVALTTLGHGNHSILCVGGSFVRALGSGDSFVAAWHGRVRDHGLPRSMREGGSAPREIGHW